MTLYTTYIHYTGYIREDIDAESKGRAILKAREKLNAPMSEDLFIKTFSRILPSLEARLEADQAFVADQASATKEDE